MQILAERTGRAEVEDGTHAYAVKKECRRVLKYKFSCVLSLLGDTVPLSQKQLSTCISETPQLLHDWERSYVTPSSDKRVNTGTTISALRDVVVAFSTRQLFPVIWGPIKPTMEVALTT